CVARFGASPSPIVDVELATAVSASQKADQQGAARSRCRTAFVVLWLSRSVISDHPLVLLERDPIDVAIVVIGDEDLRVLCFTQGAGSFHDLAIDDDRFARASSVHVRARVKRVFQNVVYPKQLRDVPFDSESAAAVSLHRKFDLLIDDPLVKL